MQFLHFSKIVFTGIENVDVNTPFDSHKEDILVFKLIEKWFLIAQSIKTDRA